MTIKHHTFLLIGLLFLFLQVGAVSAEPTNIIQVANGLVAISADGNCSLTEAVENARLGNVHADCAAGSGAGTVVMLSANGSYLFNASTANIPMGNRQVIIDGNGATLDHSDAGFFLVDGVAGSLTLRNITIEGSNGAVAAIHGGGQLHITDSVLKENVKTSGDGGAVNMFANAERHHSFVDVDFIDNSSGGRGGAVRIAAGGVASSVTVRDVSFIRNGNSFVAAGIKPSNGGALNINNPYSSNLISVSISDSEFIDNAATLGGAVYLSRTDATILTSTFEDNEAVTTGGAIRVDLEAMLHLEASTLSKNDADIGGGLYNFRGAVTIENSTFSGNTADLGGGLGNKSLAGDSATISLDFVTMTKNVADSRGGAIYNEQVGFDLAGITVRNSYIAGNSANGGVGNFDCRNDGGTLTSFGYNTQSASALNGCPFEISANASDISTALSNNGGGTKTHAIPTASVARNAIPAGSPGCDASVLDQRGFLRSSGTGTAACDIGAYESGANMAPTTTSVAIRGQSAANDASLWSILGSLCLLMGMAGWIRFRPNSSS